MIKEYLNAALKGIKERAQNPFSTSNNTPFAGAYLIALILYNWKICFSIFNFDTTATRMDKIEILSDYVKESTITERLGLPLLIAFLTIIFYYFFNFISLGITTFFTRWFKSTVLYFTDRSKNVPREEFNEFMLKLEITRKKYEEIKKDFSESQSEIEKYKEKLQDAATENTGLALEGDRMKNTIEEQKGIIENLKERVSGFEIISATYGLFSNRIDVKEIVEKELTWGGIKAENMIFKKDPLPNVMKELVIVYRNDAGIKTVIVNEHDLIKKVSDELLVESSGEGMQKEQYLLSQLRPSANSD